MIRSTVTRSRGRSGDFLTKEKILAFRPTMVIIVPLLPKGAVETACLIECGSRKVREKNPFLGLFLAWLIPGAGHLYIGRKAKGVYFFSLVTGAYFLGLFLAGFRNVNIHRFPWHYAGEIFNGGATLVVQFLTQDLLVGHFNRFLEHGTLITTVAGLLNVVVMVDFYETWAKNR